MTRVGGLAVEADGAEVVGVDEITTVTGTWLRKTKANNIQLAKFVTGAREGLDHWLRSLRLVANFC